MPTWKNQENRAAVLSEEAETDATNEELVAAINTIDRLVTTKEAHIRPFDAARLIPVFAKTMSLVADLDTTAISEMMDHARHDWSNEAIGELLLGLPLCEMDDPEASLDRHLAVDVAAALGPDWAQAWYRFVVLVTKLA